MKVPKPAATKLKKQYPDELNEVYDQRLTLSMLTNNPASNFQMIKQLSTKAQGRPLPLGKKVR